MHDITLHVSENLIHPANFEIRFYSPNIKQLKMIIGTKYQNFARN